MQLISEQVMIHGSFESLKPVDVTHNSSPDTGIFAMFYLLLDIQTFMQKFIINNIYIYYSKSQIHVFWKDNS